MHFKRRLVVLIAGLLLGQVKSHPQADPCQNFYEVACGNWSSTEATSLLGQLDYNYQEKLADLLDTEEKDDEPRFLQQLRYFYAACRRPLTQDQVLRTLEQLIVLADIQFEELTVGLTAAFRLEVLADINSDNKHEIWKQLLSRRKDWDTNTTNREPLTRDKFDELWASLPKKRSADKDLFWYQVSTLEDEIMSFGREDDGLPSDDLVTWTPTSWMLPWPHRNLTYRNLYQVAYLLKIQTPGFMLTYIYLRLRLVPEGRSRESWLIDRDECAEQSRQILSHPAAWLMEKNHPRLQEEPVLQNIFEELKQRFGQKLRANRNNFTRRTQRHLMSKLKRMRLRLSILPRNSSAQYMVRRIDWHYRDVRMNASDYFGNLYIGLNHSRPQLENSLWSVVFGRTLMPSRSSRSDLYPIQGNYGTFASPFYITQQNILIVPLSLLEPPLYSPGQPPLLTYSSLGFILGHELSHGFDSEGVTFSANGMMSRTVNREIEGNTRLQHEFRCLYRKFGSRWYEKFADASGLELAYSAYFDIAQTDRKRNRSTEHLVTQKQQFFLNFAQFFCSDEDYEQLLEQSAYGSDRKRVNDAVAHFKPFQEAFSCGTSHRRRQCRLF
ncbi:endothelin-converting enzyme homolog [Drosophila erecta]|uniref:endothelin-converting enzyme homolog n=1 Tax=Drosophila erecta TaxID=7220 RepID=UPI000F04FAA8|nr:endothelin-converting enzyme homolog [Drosophila erecta]